MSTTELMALCACGTQGTFEEYLRAHIHQAVKVGLDCEAFYWFLIVGVESQYPCTILLITIYQLLYHICYHYHNMIYHDKEMKSCTAS